MTNRLVNHRGAHRCNASFADKSPFHAGHPAAMHMMNMLRLLDERKACLSCVIAANACSCIVSSLPLGCWVISVGLEARLDGYAGSFCDEQHVSAG